MPQMSPMWWETLFLLFNLILLLINILMFWIMETKTLSIKIKTSKKESSWKW
uniref:ATP synthase F0 subunit 8 n=1 Tax=Tropidothorax cruciger TaxID=1310363 RepID=A0A7T1TVH2_9HEMI|nr:ATP synthase F0 subunit 8 [Tropidothorax cruciger]QPP20748.1 ATP synthase F0 subunit 8 [Tropidothorax cruciger]